MSRRVLIVPDKFKGTLTAQAAAQFIAQGWRDVHSADALELLPMSDGGDGFGEVLAGLLAVKPQSTETVDAAGRPSSATWWWDPAQRLAVIESARVVGLALLPSRRFHPYQLDTYGLGALFQRAAAENCAQCLVGIGGSATNDGGFGVARAAGWKFLDARANEIRLWTDLTRLAHIKPAAQEPGRLGMTVAVDVQNPLLGPAGASRVYGPQKGLQPQDFPLAEECLGRLAECARVDLGVDAASRPGTGAAGGLGFGLRVFFNARLESGFSLFARYSGLEARIRAADLVITGEGAIDSSTTMGKGVGEIARLCRQSGVPCLAMAGVTLPMDNAAIEKVFTSVHAIVPQLASSEAACASPQTWLPRLAAEVARTLPSC